MLRAKLVRALDVMTLALSLFLDASVAHGQNKPCAPSSCGNLSISYPFRLSSDTLLSVVTGYELVCENNRTLSSPNLGNSLWRKYLMTGIHFDWCMLVWIFIGIHVLSLVIPS
ncbi:hypothetical protein SLA2020_320640 [Shorea laevis]